MKGPSLAVLAAVLLVAAANAVQAQTFSLAGNWNFTTDSASNMWAYGTFSSGTNFIVPATITKSGTTEQFWLFPPTAGGSDPNIEKNVTSSDILLSAADFRPGTVSFGPYQGPAVAQFIAPSAGMYNISATFQTDQIRASTSDGTTARVYIGGVDLFTQALSDPNKAQFGTAATYTANKVALLAGEKVDFVVGGGAFTTEVDATLVELPEPSTWALMMGGGAFATLLVRRRALAA